MAAYLEILDTTDWSERAHEVQGADPGQLPGRKLVAEACLVDLLAPLLADSAPIPEHLDLMARAGWCGWTAGHRETSPGVVPPDERSVSRYATELRGLTEDFLPDLLRHGILQLFLDGAGTRTERSLNATSVKRLLFPRIPWIHRELVNSVMSGLAADGWFVSTSRGFRLAPGARERALPPVSAEVALAEVFQDVYPALTAYADLQPGAVAGLAGFIATPDRLEALGPLVDAALARAIAPFAVQGEDLPAERRVMLKVHRLLGPADEPLRLDETDMESDGCDQAERIRRADANAEARLLGPFVAMTALAGWGDPDEAWRGLKGALALHLQRLCQDLPGGLYRAAHRNHGIGSGTLASYFDGPVLISRNNGKIRAVREGEVARLERESLFLLSEAYPETRTERWLWEHVAERAEILSFQEYRALLFRMARDGFLLMSKSGASRCFRAPRPHHSVPVLRMWDRWQRLWKWLPALRKVSRAVRHAVPGSTVGRGRWVVDREDLPMVEAQIQREVGVLIRSEGERCAHLEEIDHLAMGGRRSHLIVFTRQEPWLLAQMEDPWDEVPATSSRGG